MISRLQPIRDPTARCVRRHREQNPIIFGEKNVVLVHPMPDARADNVIGVVDLHTKHAFSRRHNLDNAERR
jgi:hypothetical protein